MNPVDRSVGPRRGNKVNNLMKRICGVIVVVVVRVQKRVLLLLSKLLPSFHPRRGADDTFTRRRSIYYLSLSSYL
jgi:hypothetical protein